MLRIMVIYSLISDYFWPDVHKIILKKYIIMKKTKYTIHIFTVVYLVEQFVWKLNDDGPRTTDSKWQQAQ